MDRYDQRLEEMNEQIKSLQRANRSLLYKMEDQENQSRQKNLRIRGLSQKYKNNELIKVMQELFNPMLGKETAETFKMDRVHRIARYQIQGEDNPRDVIVRFHYAEEKSKIMEGIRKSAGIL